MTLEDEIDISRGDMIVRTHNLPQKSDKVDAIVCWMSETPLNPDGNYWVQHTTRRVQGYISELNYKIDVDTMHREAAETATERNRPNSATTARPLFYDRYQLNRATGSFILIDPYSNNTVAAGIIRGKSRRVADLVTGEIDSTEIGIAESDGDTAFDQCRLGTG